MEKIQSLTFCKKPYFVLVLILAAFFLKGVFLATLFPIFVGQDESRHYNSLQFLAEPRPITWDTAKRKESLKDTIQKYNYTQEIKETAKAVNYDDAIKGELYNTSRFKEGHEGTNEAEINERKWRQYNTDYPVNHAGQSLYHRSASVIEKTFGSQSILVRYFLARIFSVLLGTIAILLSFLIAKNIGFSDKISLLLAAMIAFQPRFSIYYASINYDTLLIVFFMLFTLGGVLALKNGLDWKNLSLMILSIFLGIMVKATAAILLIIFIALLAYFSHKKIRSGGTYAKYAIYMLLILAAVPLFIYFKKYFLGTLLPLDTLLTSIISYLDKNMAIGKFTLSSRTYWGALTWVNNWILDNFTNMIWILEFFSAAGLASYFFMKKKLDFLPEKRYAAFLLIMIVMLQIGIRTADWLVFKNTKGLELGTPGRYFLPNIAAHMILVFIGIGTLLRKKEWLERSLVIGLILMMAFSMYIIFDVIIYRYYL